MSVNGASLVLMKVASAIFGVLATTAVVDHVVADQPVTTKDSYFTAPSTIGYTSPDVNNNTVGGSATEDGMTDTTRPGLDTTSPATPEPNPPIALPKPEFSDENDEDDDAGDNYKEDGEGEGFGDDSYEEIEGDD